jgi:hypothetical protein
MKTANILIAALIGCVIGLLVGAGGFHQLTKGQAQQLRQQIKDREAKVDSLRSVTVVLTDSLSKKQQVTIKEKIKYYEIKPKSYSFPDLDSLFRARYEK